jgi:hypothetical protein
LKEKQKGSKTILLELLKFDYFSSNTIEEACSLLLVFLVELPKTGQSEIGKRRLLECNS